MNFYRANEFSGQKQNSSDRCATRRDHDSDGPRSYPRLHQLGSNVVLTDRSHEDDCAYFLHAMDYAFLCADVRVHSRDWRLLVGTTKQDEGATLAFPGEPWSVADFSLAHCVALHHVSNLHFRNSLIILLVIWMLGCVVYAVWIVVILMLFPVCRWFAQLKQCRRDWWLTYL
jgi:hypothetical protein